MESKKQKNNIKAFTIVELLIVIVIIGILAAITIVSYTGITSRANQTTIISDLTSAKKQFELYKVDHGVYPTGLENGTNCLTGTNSPSPDTRYCLKSTTGSTYTLEDATGSDYTLKLIKGTVAYKVTKDLAPTSTAAAVTAASFVKTWGGASADYAYGLVQTTDGGFAMSGYTANFGAGGIDVFLAKYDASGNPTWSKTWGGTGNEYAYNLIQTTDGGYAMSGQTTGFGAGSNDAFLVKFDASGNLNWSKTWGGAGVDFARGVIQATDGGYVISGPTASFGAGSNDAFLAKYDASGNLTWSKTWGGAGNDYDQGGLIRTTDGGYVMSGLTVSFGAGSNDAFLAKYDSSGNLIWNKTWGGAGNDYSQGGIIQTTDGGYAMSGLTDGFGAGSNDAFLAKYDASANLTWSKTWGGAGSDVGYNGLIQTTDGGYAMSGQTASFGAGSNDAFLIKTNPLGEIAGCSATMCKSQTATVTSPTATATAPSATVTSPSATVTSPSATVTSPSATNTTIVAAP